MCPYHDNRATYAFSVNKVDGRFVCFNAACGEFGSLLHLVKDMTKRNDYEALRLIQAKADGTHEDYINDLLEASKPFEFKEWQPDTIKQLQAGMTSDSAGMQYMLGRGISEDTVNYFGVGYSQARNMVAIPVHSPDGLCVGIVGRSIADKSFKNSKGLPRRQTMFNIHRAKRIGSILVVCEASFDAMRIHQAGYPNVAAVLGGQLSKDCARLIDRMFDTVIIMTDADEPGRRLGEKLIKMIPGKNFLWASHGYREIYARGVKDATDMTDPEIARCIENSVSNFEYISWGLDDAKKDVLQ